MKIFIKDFDCAKEGSEYADIRQTSKIGGHTRGHQFAMAFLALGSRLDEVRPKRN